MSASGSSYATAISSLTNLAGLPNLLRRALSDPVVLFYGAILSAARKQLSSLRSAEDGGAPTVDALIEVVQLLSVGTCATVPSLSPSASKFVDATVREKLNQLTVLSVCHQFFGRDASTDRATIASSRKAGEGGDLVAYQLLAENLGLDLEAPSGLRLLEDVLLDTLSNGLICGRLNRKQQSLWVRHGQMQCRDVADPVQSASRFKAILGAWAAQCDAQVLALEGRNGDAQQLAAAKQERMTFLGARQAAAMEHAKDLMLQTTSMSLRGHEGLVADDGGRRAVGTGSARSAGAHSGKRRDY